MALYLGLDIGGTKCAAVLGDERGAVLDKRRLPTAGAAAPNMLAALAAAGREMAGGQPLAAVGVSCGGPLDEDDGVVLSPPNLPGWDAVPVVQMLSQALGVPAFLRNDANACALAEWRFGAAKGLQHCVFLTFGTGMGAGLVLGGRLYAGAKGLAGEVGHWRLSSRGPVGYGVAGSFEGWCSGGGLAQQAQRLYGRPMTAAELAEAALAGDGAAAAVWRRCGRRLGQGVALLVDALAPQAVVIGSIYPRAQALLEAPMRAALRRAALPQILQNCRILPAALGERLGDVAALSVAMDGLEAAAGVEKQ